MPFAEAGCSTADAQEARWIEPRHIATVRHFRRRRRAIFARGLLEALAVAD